VNDRERVEKALRDDAERRLGAGGDPDCFHRFALHVCRGCDGLTFRVTIERHPGDEPGDFRGIVWTACVQCGCKRRLLSVTDINDADCVPLAVEDAACPCGAAAFHVASCERWESWGFFDEGTLVARCSHCGEPRHLADTD
jgi:hypothetical protein